MVCNLCIRNVQRRIVEMYANAELMFQYILQSCVYVVDKYRETMCAYINLLTDAFTFLENLLFSSLNFQEFTFH